MWNNISITMKNCKEKYVSMRFNAVFTTMTVNNDDEDNQPTITSTTANTALGFVYLAYYAGISLG